MAKRPLTSKQAKQLKTDDVKRAGRVTRNTVASAAAGGIVGAGFKASDLANPGTVDRVVRKAVEDPEGGSSAMRDVFERVPLEAAPMNEIVDAAANFGGKAALAAGAIGLGVSAVNAIRNRNAQKASFHQRNAISRAVSLSRQLNGYKKNN